MRGNLQAAPVRPPSKTSNTLAASIVEGIRPYARTMTLTLVILASAQGMAWAQNETLSASITGYLHLLMLIGPAFFCAWLVIRFLHMMIVTKPASPLRAYWADLRDLFFSADRWITGLPFLGIIFLFSTAFTYFKESIPKINPFAWDKAFADMDLLIHAGRHPWEWLQPVLGYPLITFLINAVYNSWFIIMVCVWLWLALTRSKHVPRQRFLMAFVLTWAIGGVLLAIFYSSAGPAYYAHLVEGVDPYAGLMEYLRTVDQTAYPIFALHTQDALWASYAGDPEATIAGISAMPSMHVATATLFIPLAHRFGRLALSAAITFFCLIMIGSVHLGWHYAVDGYLGAAIAAGAWIAAGSLIGGHDGVAQEEPAAIERPV